MATLSLPIGPFSQIYVGNFGSSSVLTTMLDLNTGPANLVDMIDEQYEVVLGNTIQTGLRKVTVSLSFYGLDDQLINLARGLPVGTVGGTGVSSYLGSAFSQYVLLLAHPADPAPYSVLLTQCYTVKHLGANYSKTQASQIDIQFIATNRNIFEPIFYIDSLDNLATILGSSSPV